MAFVPVAIAAAWLALLAGCSSLPAPTRPLSAASAAAPADTPVQALTPKQALRSDAQGARVRWWGGVDRVEAMGDGRDCISLRWAPDAPTGGPQWSNDASLTQVFVACGPGHYPRALVEPFTELRIQGRVSGPPQRAWGMDAPVLQIELLERSSNCLESEADGVAHPQCRSGRIDPQ